MIEVYLNYNGDAHEAAIYYAQVFDAPEPYIMRYSDMPKEEHGNAPDVAADLVMHANVKTFAGDIMLSDVMPGQSVTPSAANWITVSHTDQARLRRVFDGLAEGGEVLLPLEPAFFSPLFGQVKDKFGFYWLVMSSEETGF